MSTRLLGKSDGQVNNSLTFNRENSESITADDSIMKNYTAFSGVPGPVPNAVPLCVFCVCVIVCVLFH